MTSTNLPTPAAAAPAPRRRKQPLSAAPCLRPLDCRRAARPRRVEDRLAHDGHQRHRRSAGIVDHVLVGHLVGYQGNAAIGVSWQIMLVVIVFIARSLPE